jgi:hypothetical protein
MSGSSVSGGGYVSSAPDPWYLSPYFGDFNGDGRDDLLWQTLDGSVATWLMNGTTQSGGFVASVGDSWLLKDTGDYNGDGKDDILWQNSDDGTVAAWLMNGTSILPGNGYVSSASADWDLKSGYGDFNGDGKDDILWQHTDGTVAVWLMNGTSPSGSIVAPAGNEWTLIDVFDYNGDGKDDILWEEVTDFSPPVIKGNLAAWFMNGASVIGLSSPGEMDLGDLRSADYNGNGASDILRETQGFVDVFAIDGTPILPQLAVSSDWFVSG